MRKFSVYQNQENIPVKAMRCPCPAAKICDPKCVRKPTAKVKAFQDISTNARIPPSSTCLNVGTSSSTKLKGDSCNQRKFNSLAKQEMLSIFYAEKKQLLAPTEYSWPKPRSADEVTHGTKFYYDSVESTSKNDHSSKNSEIEKYNRERSRSTSIRDCKGLASSKILQDPSKNAPRRTRSDFVDSGYSESWNSGTTLSRVDGLKCASSTKLYETSVDTKSWNSLYSTGKSLSSLDVKPSTHCRIPMNLLTSPSTLISERPKNHRSAKLKKRVNSRVGPPGYTEEDEYAEDLLLHVLMFEENIILPIGFLKRFGPDPKTRATLVDWILGLQEHIHISDAELYLAVNLFDQILARTSVPTNMLQLLALVTIWIANKYIGPDHLRASDLVWYTNNAYVGEQLLKMERRVLKILKFKIHYVEPSLFVEIFLKVLGLGNDDLAKFTSHYFLDCTTLVDGFSSFPVSVLAAAAVNVVIKMYYPMMENTALYYFMRIMTPKHEYKMKLAESQILAQITLMKDENYMFGNAFRKNKAMRRNY